MAKLVTKKSDDEQVVNANFDDISQENVESGENTENSENESSTDTPAEANTAKIRSNLVQIRTNRNHKCTIGGTRYVFIKGQRYNVPEDVKRILSVAGILTNL